MSRLLFISPNERGMPRSIGVVSQSVQRGVPGVHSVIELHDKAATRPAVDAEIANADCILYFGHGQMDALGASGKRLVDDQNLAPHQVLVALACHSGAGLGPTVFGSGVKVLYGQGASGAFVGFDKVLLHPARRPSRANQAYENALLVFVAGGSVLELASDLASELLTAADDYLARRSPDALFCFAALRSNAVGISLHGTGDAGLQQAEDEDPQTQRDVGTRVEQSRPRYHYVLHMSGNVKSMGPFFSRLKSVQGAEARLFANGDDGEEVHIDVSSSEPLDEVFTSISSDTSTPILEVTRSLA